MHILMLLALFSAVSNFGVCAGDCNCDCSCVNNKAETMFRDTYNCSCVCDCEGERVTTSTKMKPITVNIFQKYLNVGYCVGGEICIRSVNFYNGEFDCKCAPGISQTCWFSGTPGEDAKCTGNIDQLTYGWILTQPELY
ncbi:uncharacterized protein LOC142355212 [Convolutriloba macropyga]|uniref:uncharacterized protein LOC142355212 n=1 Tax=Convolutriloba macropyga TaxID=536237 RepID=UPI003F5244AC